jgi:hypothetical protein
MKSSGSRRVREALEAMVVPAQTAREIENCRRKRRECLPTARFKSSKKGVEQSGAAAMCRAVNELEAIFYSNYFEKLSIENNGGDV